jgi:ABC-type transporter Mla MlaB component
MATIERHNDQLSIIGEVGFKNVEACLSDVLVQVHEHKNKSLNVNFEQVKHLDGSIVALMISLLRHAKSLGIKVNYFNVPMHILRVSELYGVRSILPIVVQ